MKQRVILCLLFLCGCTQKQDANDELNRQEVESIASEYDKAWNSKDTARVNKLLGSEYIYFSSPGELNTRAEILEFLKDPRYIILDARRSEVETRITGNVAVVSSHWKGELIWKGDSIHDNQRCGQVYIKRHGKTQLISEHCVAIQPER